MPYTFVIADDHPFTVAGMDSLIGEVSDFSVVGTANNGIDAIGLIKQFQPDMALLDLAMPGANGLETFLEAKRWAAKTRFAIITGVSASALFGSLIEAGIDGLFLKNCAPEELEAGIRGILAGRRFIAAEVEEAMTQIADGSSFSKRELQVLHELGRGSSNAQIAAKLGISPKTIDTHRTNLLRKMKVNSTAALLVAAMRKGLLQV